MGLKDIGFKDGYTQWIILHEEVGWRVLSCTIGLMKRQHRKTSRVIPSLQCPVASVDWNSGSTLDQERKTRVKTPWTVMWRLYKLNCLVFCRLQHCALIPWKQASSTPGALCRITERVQAQSQMTNEGSTFLIQCQFRANSAYGWVMVR